MLQAPGSVYVDDATILDSDTLYRMVPVDGFVWQEDAVVRLKSGAFQDQSSRRTQEDGYPAVAMSVYIRATMEDHGILLEDLARQWGEDYGLARFTAGQAREQNQGVVRDPRDGSPAHGLVFAREGAKKTLGQSKALARAAEIVRPPRPPAA